MTDFPKMQAGKREKTDKIINKAVLTNRIGFEKKI